MNMTKLLLWAGGGWLGYQAVRSLYDTTSDAAATIQQAAEARSADYASGADYAAPGNLLAPAYGPYNAPTIPAYVAPNTPAAGASSEVYPSTTPVQSPTLPPTTIVTNPPLPPATIVQQNPAAANPPIASTTPTPTTTTPTPTTTAPTPTPTTTAPPPVMVQNPLFPTHSITGRDPTSAERTSERELQLARVKSLRPSAPSGKSWTLARTVRYPDGSTSSNGIPSVFHWNAWYAFKGMPNRWVMTTASDAADLTEYARLLGRTM